MAKITPEELTELVSQLEEFYSTFRSQCDKEDTYYNLTFEVPEVSGFSAHRPASARIAIDSAAAQVDPADIIISVPPRTTKPEHKEAAIRLQEFYHGCWGSILRENSTLYTRVLKNMYHYGVGIWKVMYDATAYADAPKDEGEQEVWRSQRTNEFPFKVFVKHPKNIMVDPSYFSMNRYDYVIEKYTRKYGEVKLSHPAFEKAELSINSDVTWVEYWDNTGYIKMCNGEVIQPYTEHGYGMNPYQIIDAGLGYEDADGLPENRWRGILNASHYDLEFEARILYQVEAILRMQAFGPQDFEAYDPVVDEPTILKFQKDYEWHPATKNVLPYGIRKSVPPAISIPSQVFAILGVVKESINDATVAASARGQRPAGAASGYMAAVLIGEARIKFGPALSSLQHATEAANRCFAHFIENFCPQGISVWGKIGTKSFDIKIKPKDIDGYYINEVQLSSIAPEEESRRIADGLKIFQVGLASKEYVQTKYLKMRDTYDDAKQQLVEATLSDPSVRQAIIQSLVSSQDFQAQLGIMETPATVPTPPPAGNPMGNMGITPSPAGVMGQIPPTKVPMAAGSPEEMDLVARQRTGQPQLQAETPIGGM